MNRPELLPVLFGVIAPNNDFTQEDEHSMTSKALIDPQLLALLEQMPSLETSSETLAVMRQAVGDWRLTAPEAPEVSREERFVVGSDGRAVRILVYSPKGTALRGGLLWVHGGGMVMGTPEINDAPNRYLAQQAGCVVVAVAYSLAPEHPYPAGLEDCYAALRWMHHEGAALGIPRTRIAVAGESGGGALCAGLSLLVRDRGELSLSGQFLMFPMLDDRTGTHAEPASMPFSGEFVWTRTSNQFCWQSVLGQVSPQTGVPVYASPGRSHTLAGLPPTFLSVGDVDLFIAEDLRFAQQLIHDGVSTELHVYPGAAHGFTAWGAQTQIAQRCQGEFWDAIVRHFRTSPA